MSRMSDLISRQALCEYALNQKDKSVTPNDIMRFPSAQPEIVTCQDCRYWKELYHEYECAMAWQMLEGETTEVNSICTNRIFSADMQEGEPMTDKDKDRIKCAIRHIKSSVDVDAWAMEIAVNAMKAQLSEEGTTFDCISRQDAIDEIARWKGYLDEDMIKRIQIGLKKLPSVQPEYEPVTAEDFAKTMSENTIYGFMAWHGEAFTLIKEMGFEICKKTM